MVIILNKKWIICLILVLFAGILHAISIPNEEQQLAPIISTPEVTLTVPSGVPVLMYHSIGEEINNDAVISRDRFVAQMKYLYQNGYHPISLEDLYGYLSAKKALPSKPVVISFDDGYRDTYEVAFPVLQQYGFKSVLFIPAGEVGKALSWQELREMKAAGMEIASHSFHHVSLSDLSIEEQRVEISKSKELLDQYLEQDSKYFCYPNGSYTQKTLQLLKDNGFVLAVTIDPGWAKSGDDPLTLRRIWMGNTVELRHLEERLTREDYPLI